MEALEDKYVKNDSFNEVDRILTIVEESKREIKIADKTDNLLGLVFGVILSGSFGLTLSAFRNYSFWLTIINPNSIIIFAVFCIGLILYLLFYLNERIKDAERTKIKSEIIVNQATEVLREIVPALSRSERWSVLQKFELRLRLSRLGISVDKIFEPEM